MTTKGSKLPGRLLTPYDIIGITKHLLIIVPAGKRVQEIHGTPRSSLPDMSESLQSGARCQLFGVR